MFKLILVIFNIFVLVNGSTPTFKPTNKRNGVVVTRSPTKTPTRIPTGTPSFSPVYTPSVSPTQLPTKFPSFSPTFSPTHSPSFSPSLGPTSAPKTLSAVPTASPSVKQNHLTIDLMFTYDFKQEHKDLIISASKVWESIIVSDYPSVYTIYPGSIICGQFFGNGAIVKNILVVIGTIPIDGAGNVLARAGSCAFDAAGFPRLGQISFDLADLDYVYNTQRMFSVSEHEIGHVLGLGTIWSFRGLVTTQGTNNPYEYLGVNGNEGNIDVGGTGRAAIENLGGSGTALAHWKESVYEDELMTGWSQPSPQKMPLSIMTVKALKDLSFVVDVSKAEAYIIPSKRSGRRLKGKQNGINLSKIRCEAISGFIIVDTVAKEGREEEFNSMKEKFIENYL